MLKVICILAVVVLTCHQLEAAPNGHKSITDMSQAELMHKFETFMSQDKEAAEIRQLYEREVAGHRLRKRQAELNGMDEVEGEDGVIQAAGNDGFLDRAAKFVLELVQRFLKWINTD